MRKFLVYWEGHLAGDSGTEEFELQDDASQELIDECAMELALQHFSWGTEEVGGGEK